MTMDNQARSQRRRIVMAFSDLPLTAASFRLAERMTRAQDTELSLLRIQPADGSPPDGEQLYSELRTLHAQLQERGIRARLWAEPGRGDEPIRTYLTRHPVDLLVVVSRKESGDPDGDDDLLDAVIASAPCPALVVA